MGYRTICLCGTRDPILIKQIDSYLQSVRSTVMAKVREAFDNKFGENDFYLNFRQYGRNAVMGPLEHEDFLSHELGLLIEVVAGEPQISKAILSLARSNLLHHGFPGRVCTGGNMAIAFSPSDIYLGPAYQFCLNHIVELEDPLEFFKMEMVKL